MSSHNTEMRLKRPCEVFNYVSLLYVMLFIMTRLTRDAVDARSGNAQ